MYVQTLIINHSALDCFTTILGYNWAVSTRPLPWYIDLLLFNYFVWQLPSCLSNLHSFVFYIKVYKRLEAWYPPLILNPLTKCVVCYFVDQDTRIWLHLYFYSCTLWYYAPWWAASCVLARSDLPYTWSISQCLSIRTIQIVIYGVHESFFLQNTNI